MRILASRAEIITDLTQAFYKETIHALSYSVTPSYAGTFI